MLKKYFPLILPLFFVCFATRTMEKGKISIIRLKNNSYEVTELKNGREYSAFITVHHNENGLDPDLEIKQNFITENASTDCWFISTKSYSTYKMKQALLKHIKQEKPQAKKKT